MARPNAGHDREVLGLLMSSDLYFSLSSANRWTRNKIDYFLMRYHPLVILDNLNCLFIIFLF